MTRSQDNTENGGDFAAPLGLVTYGPIEQTDGATVQYDIIRDRVLTSGRPTGGRIVSIRLIEGEDEEYSIMVRVSWRKGEYLLARRESNDTKTYKNLSAIVRRCRSVYQYDGPISLETEHRV